MRAAPLLLFLPLVLVGCGSAEYAAKRSSMKSDAMTESTAAPAMSAQAAKAADMSFGRSGGLAGGAPASPPANGAAYLSGKKEAGEGAQAAAYVPEAPRMMVRNGELSLRVKDVKIAEAQVREVARAARGSIEGSVGAGLEGASPSLSVTLRVPEPKFDDTLVNLENLGVRLSKSITTDDVTAQAVDMEARIKSLRVQEDAYRAILGAARKISDVLEVQERLTGIRTEIEQIVAQRRNLGDEAARSKIVLTLSQTQPTAPPPPALPAEPGWFARVWSDSTGALASVVQGLATLGLWLLVMSPVWVPLGLVSLFVYRRTRQTQAV